jgi:hypothetical protein
VSVRDAMAEGLQDPDTVVPDGLAQRIRRRRSGQPGG